MFTVRGDDDVVYSTTAALGAVADDLRADGIEVRLIARDQVPGSPMVEAWYISNPGRVAIIQCDSTMVGLDTVDCLATTIRERLRSAEVDPLARVTWDHTGTIWPD